nr:unnamed protein product [Callosobruchus analis]
MANWLRRAIKFGISRLVSKSDDEEESSNNNTLRCPKDEICYSGDERMSPPRYSSDNIWEGKESPRPSTSTSPELEVDSPPHSRTNSPSPVTEIPKIESSTKNSEAFSVSALLRPDNPKKADNPCYQETVSGIFFRINISCVFQTNHI